MRKAHKPGEIQLIAPAVHKTHLITDAHFIELFLSWQFCREGKTWGPLVGTQKTRVRAFTYPVQVRGTLSTLVERWPQDRSGPQLILPCTVLKS